MTPEKTQISKPQTIKADDTHVYFFTSHGNFWVLANGKTKWAGVIEPFSPSLGTGFKYKIKSQTKLEKNGRKTDKVISHTFKIGADSFTLVQEASTIKDFPGVFFHISLKNVGSLTTLGDIQFFFSMKEKSFFSWKGEQEVKRPFMSNIENIRNWVFMPNTTGSGLALISNFSLPDTVFVSRLVPKSMANSRWGLRKLKQQLKPEKKSELVFALIPADSPEETIKLCKKLMTENIFPELKLQDIDCSIQKQDKKQVAIEKKTEVKPLLNTKYYSAGKTPAETIENWVKKEIRPELYNIWLNKKDRISLNGAWKLLKLAGTRDIPNCEYGTSHGFEKSVFDDSKWFNQPVPYFWNVSFNQRNGNIYKERIVFGGVGWYRRKFNIPDTENGKRVILCLPGINEEATIYINGKKVAYHKNVTCERAWRLLHQMEYGYFEVDITPYLNFGRENTIAVRAYDDGDFFGPLEKENPVRMKNFTSVIGGIWQEVYLEIRPEIYLKKAMLNYNVKDSTTRVKAYVVNTKKEAVKENLRLDLIPWKSARYSLAQGKSFKKTLGEQTLKPGLNELTFEFKIEKPQLWSPEHPFLYEMKLSDDRKNMLGMERVGFREFSAGKDSFYLNGKKITLRGQQSLWMTMIFALMNRCNRIEKWFAKYKNLNHNLTRNHGTLYPHSFYDIADEKGIMIYCGQPLGPLKPFFDGDGKMTDFYRRRIRDRAEELMRHPSIVAFSMGNELYDSKLFGQKIDVYQHFIDQVYDEFKKHNDVTLLSSSGRAPTLESIKKSNAKAPAISTKYAKTDFYAIHNYQLSFMDLTFAEDDDWSGAFKKHSKAYAMDGGAKVMWDTESGVSSIPIFGSRLSLKQDKIFRSHMRNNMLDRSWFAKNWSNIETSKGHDNFNNLWSVSKFGFLDVMMKDRAMKAQAGFMKRMTELHRRKRHYVAGVIANCPMIFHYDKKDRSAKYIEPVATAVKKANQPVLACLDGKWNRNIFSGKNPSTPIHLMNDHEKTISDTQLSIVLKPLDLDGADIPLKTVNANNLAPAEIKSVDYAFEIPENINSGHYSVILTVMYKYQGQKRVSTNDYKTFILNRKDVKLKNGVKQQIAVLGGTGMNAAQTIAMLKKLKVPFTIVDDMKNLANFKILLAPAYCESFPNGIANWVKNGGKLICLEQQKMPDGIPQKITKNPVYGYLVELILPTHPILNGLEQSDFRYWNGESSKIQNKWVSEYSLLPLNEGVIASQTCTGYRIGMNISEYIFGKGVCLLSQMDAVKRFETDSVATKYLLNILDYCLLDWSAPDTPMIKEIEFSGPVFKIAKKDAFFINIRPACTMAFADEKAYDGKGGWTDQGPEKDLRGIPIGKQTFNGVPFDIIDPDTNGNKSCVVLKGSPITSSAFLPGKRRIVVNHKANRLYFLVSAAWAGGDKPIAKINISEQGDGSEMTSFFQIDLVPGENISDWTNTTRQPGAELGWTGLANDQSVGTFIVEWINPNPHRIIQYIDFESTRIGIPAIIGITGLKNSVNHIK